MDLGSIFWKLKDSTYRDAASFFADVHLVRSVCFEHGWIGGVGLDELSDFQSEGESSL